MRIKRSIGDIIFDVLNYSLLTLLSLFTLYPFIYVFSMSVSNKEAVLGMRVRLLPIGFSLESVYKALETAGLSQAYLNTIWYVVMGTLVATTVTFTMAYALSRRNFFMRKFLSVYVIITMLFNGGLIPLFMVVRGLGLNNTRWTVIVMGACSVWNLMITRVFIERNIPESLIESARIDGYNDISIFVKIVLPLSKQILAIISMFNAVGFWNQYFTSMVFAPKENLKPLQILLMEILLQNKLMESAQQTLDSQLAGQRMLYLMQVKYVVILFAIVPIMCVYPFVQKYFVKGVMIGAIKE